MIENKKGIVFGIMIAVSLIISIIMICLALISNINILIPMLLICIGFVLGSFVLFMNKD
ncbi:MAG: hypothetical protein NSGCLCUN01_01296 [uncultured Clostridium sp.]